MKHCTTNQIGADWLACRTHTKLCAACLIIETTNNGLPQQNGEPAVEVWFHSPAAQDQLSRCIRAFFMIYSGSVYSESRKCCTNKLLWIQPRLLVETVFQNNSLYTFLKKYQIKRLIIFVPKIVVVWVER